MKIGFIGLGAMGRPMAGNLLKRGHSLHVFARRPEAAQPLVDAGATAWGSPREVAARSDMVFTMVTATSDVEEVMLGVGGIVEGARPGTVVVDASTIAPDAARVLAARLAERQVDLLDAPVSGGVIGAVDGTLSIMAGGRAEAFERALPVLRAIGKTIVYVGESGAGQTAKACNQLVIVVALQGIAEALALARRCGVDGGKVVEALSGGFAGSRILEVMGGRMASGDFEPGVESRLHHKDAGIVTGLAGRVGLALPAAALAEQFFNALVGAGHGNRDSAMLVKIVEGIGA